MIYTHNNIKIDIYKESNKPKIEEKLIVLKTERQNMTNDISSFNNVPNKNNYAPYYSNVIKRQNSHSPNHTILLHDFVDDKKITYKDITNKIDINELSSKIKNILINIQRIKSNEQINTNNENKPNIYQRKTKSSYSYRQTNSSFTTENESKNSYNMKNFYINKNSFRNKPTNNDTFYFNLNLNNYLNNNYKNIINIENKSYENHKYYNKTLKEYLNEQINTIKCKRNKINETNISNNNNNNEIDHNYSIDNEIKDLLDGKKDNILNNLDNLLILSNTKNKKHFNEDEIILSDNKTKKNIQIKCKNFEEKIINNKNSKNISNYLTYKQNNLTRNSKKKYTQKANNTFRNSHINLNLSKHNTMRNLNKDFTNKKLKSQCINYNKMDSYILPKPLKVNSKIYKNDINKFNNNNSYSKLNVVKTSKSKKNSEIIKTCRVNDISDKIKKNLKDDLYKNKYESKEKKILNNKKKKFEFKERKYKKKKNYSEIIRNKIHSASQKKIKVRIENKKI